MLKILPKFVRSTLAVSIVICILVSLVVIGLRISGKLQFLELAAYDYYTLFRSKIFSHDSRIVLITINEEDIQRQKRWPLTDYTLAHLLKNLIAHNPRVIGLDIYRDIPVPPGEEELKSVFSKNYNIVTIQKIAGNSSVGVPLPYVNPEFVGFSDNLVDIDKVVRRGLLFLDDGETVYYSFPLLLTLLYLSEEGIYPQPGRPNPEHLRLGETTFVPIEANDGSYVNADARGYQFLIDYPGAHESFMAFSLTDVLEGEVSPEAINDKIVIIGVSAESVKDTFTSPISRFMGFDKTMYGIELHANIVSQLLRSAFEGSKPLAFLREPYEWCWIFLWSLMAIPLGLWIRSFWRLFLMGLSGLCILVLITYLAFKTGWWIPVVPPAISWFVSVSLIIAHVSYQENAKRMLLMQLFSKHVSNDIAESIWLQRDEFMDNGRPRPQKLIATVLFTDLKDFTSVSEKMEPQCLMNWLNEYMEAMSQTITKYNGVILRFIGDSIMVAFGVPLARTNEEEIKKDAVSAVSCAIAMGEELTLINTKWKARNLPQAKMRIGIYTGTLVAGTLGDTRRMEYSIYGDTVNIASRLESYDKDTAAINFKDCSARILIGDATLKRLGNHFETKMVGKVKLKGKEEKITTYMVLNHGSG